MEDELKDLIKLRLEELTKEIKNKFKLTNVRRTIRLENYDIKKYCLDIKEKEKGEIVGRVEYLNF